jgi:hypothetical protein
LKPDGKKSFINQLYIKLGLETYLRSKKPCTYYYFLTCFIVKIPAGPKIIKNRSLHA